MKRCKDCGVEKSLDEFYAHPRMSDGRLNSCKECRIAYQKRQYRRTIEDRRAYEQKRFRKPERKAKLRTYQLCRRARTPEKCAARNAVGNAIRDGRLERPTACSACGCKCKPQAHHTDYSKPLDVEWLCFRCHRAAHGQVAV